jgi:hypothetical protein
MFPFQRALLSGKYQRGVLSGARNRKLSTGFSRGFEWGALQFHAIIVAAQRVGACGASDTRKFFVRK